MKKLLLAVIAIVLLSGCGTAGAPKETTSASKDFSSLSTADKNTAFLNRIHSAVPEFSNSNDKSLLAAANAFCSLLKEGNIAPKNVVATAAKNLSQQSASIYVSAIVQVYCPEHMTTIASLGSNPNATLNNPNSNLNNPNKPK